MSDQPQPESEIMRALRDATQTIINATTTLWYGTDDALTPGKALRCKGDPQFGTPPFVLVHPDDVAKLPPGARHIREHALTWVDIAALPPLPISYEVPEQPFVFRVRRKVFL